MPRYDYKCGSCGHRFEERQSFDSEPVAKCPECQGTSSRQFHAVPIVFKGSGFYVNDYGKSSSYSSKPNTNGGSEESSSATEKSPSKSESKAETTTPTTASPSSSSSSSTSKDD